MRKDQKNNGFQGLLKENVDLKWINSDIFACQEKTFWPKFWPMFPFHNP